MVSLSVVTSGGVVEQGPLLGAKHEELRPYLAVMESVLGKTVLVTKANTGYGAYLFSFVAKRVFCVLPEEEVERSRLFFKEPNLIFFSEEDSVPLEYEVSFEESV